MGDFKESQAKHKEMTQICSLLKNDNSDHLN